MLSFRSLILLAVFAALTAPLIAVADPTHLAVTFSGSEVVISGVTPRHQAVLVGLAREPMGYYTSLNTFYEVLEDQDGDGTVRFDTKSTLNWKSIWGAVDLQTGDYVVALPEHSPGRETGFKGKGLGRDNNGKLTKLEQEGQWLDLLLVRPTGDVFRALVVDGGPYDEDGTNDNVVHASLDALELERGKGQKPDEFKSKDVLFVINPDDLTMVAVQVK